jgi:stage III sporulation protein AH
MKTWKRNAIIAGVLVLVCTGIYLNWLYGKGNATNLTDTLDADKVMGESTLVLSDETAEKEALAEENTADAASGYFAQVRLSRQTARDEAVNTLQETIAYADGGDTTSTSKQLESIVSSALTEAQIESMVIAKGYKDCVAYITEEGISVAVAAPDGGLKEQDVALITDVIESQGNFTLDQIRVIEVD